MSSSINDVNLLSETLVDLAAAVDAAVVDLAAAVAADAAAVAAADAAAVAAAVVDLSAVAADDAADDAADAAFDGGVVIFSGDLDDDDFCLRGSAGFDGDDTTN